VSEATPNGAADLPYPDADLREHPPRSPRVMLGGLYFLARTIDKTRAKLQGTLGIYKVSPGISQYLFEWLGVTEDEFTQAVRVANDDEDVVEWLLARADPATFAAINERLAERGIRDDEHFAQVLPRYPVLREHPHLRNWFEILDVDDRWIFDSANAEKAEESARS
jgi:antirestriction protein ArdC